MSGNREKRICLGVFAGAHGVKGAALVKTFTDKPENIAAYGPVETKDGKRSFLFEFVRRMKPDVALVEAPEIASREDAQNLKGKSLFIERDRLPPLDEDEFYLEDLVGLAAVDETGAPLGVVSAVYNFGAGDVVELTDTPGTKGASLIAFTKETIPHIDIAGQRMTILRSAVDADDAANRRGNA